MAIWAEFESAAPELAATGRALLYQQPPHAGAFLGTVRADGGPRLHPVAPVIAEGQLWALIVTMSYKYRDLRRDPRYALHTYPTVAGGEEFYLMGEATEVTDALVRATAGAARGGQLLDFEALFALDIGRVLHTHWDGWGTATPWPHYEKWAAAGG